MSGSRSASARPSRALGSSPTSSITAPSRRTTDASPSATSRSTRRSVPGGTTGSPGAWCPRSRSTWCTRALSGSPRACSVRSTAQGTSRASASFTPWGPTGPSAWTTRSSTIARSTRSSSRAGTRSRSNPRTPTFYSDVWSHQLGGRGAQSKSDLVDERCYEGDSIRPLPESVARAFRVDDDPAPPAHVEHMAGRRLDEAVAPRDVLARAR